MGKQLNFFMTEADEAEFLAALRRLGSLVLVRERAASAEPQYMEALPSQGSQAAREGVVLFNPSVDPTIAMIRATAELHYVDKENSAVVEFRQSEPFEGTIRPGRVWAEMATAAGHKSDGFRKWYDSITGWIRKNYRKDSDGYYVAPGAEALVSNATPPKGRH